MLKVWQHLLNSWPLEGKWEDPLSRRDSIQAHKVWQEFLNIKLFWDIWDHTGKSHSWYLKNPWEDPLRRDSSVARAQSVTSVFNIKFLEGAWEDPHRGEAFQMLEVWQELLLLEIGPLLYIKLLETHERIHSGGIQFKCTKCDKWFSRSSYRKSKVKKYLMNHFGTI